MTLCRCNNISKKKENSYIRTENTFIFVSRLFLYKTIFLCVIIIRFIEIVILYLSTIFSKYSLANFITFQNYKIVTVLLKLGTGDTWCSVSNSKLTIIGCRTVSTRLGSLRTVRVSHRHHFHTRARSFPPALV